jgi:hypothetical protein
MDRIVELKERVGVDEMASSPGPTTSRSAAELQRARQGVLGRLHDDLAVEAPVATPRSVLDAPLENADHCRFGVANGFE